MKLMLAAVPTMMLGTELISVSRPPTLVSKPSTSRNPSSLSFRSSLLSDTAVSDPTMIIAVTLFNTALNTTVMTPYSQSSRTGSPPDALVSRIAIQVKSPERDVTSTNRLAPKMIVITPQSIAGM